MTGAGGGDMWSSLPLGSIGAGMLLLIVCYWITRRVIRGDLVPRQSLLDVQAVSDQWRESATTWQKVATEHGMTLEKHTATLEKLLTYAETTQHVVTEIQRAAAGEHR